MLEILNIKFQSNLAYIAQLACLYMLEMVFCYILHLNLYNQIIQNYFKFNFYKYHLLYDIYSKYQVLVKFSFYSTIGMFIYVGNGVLLYITSKLVRSYKIILNVTVYKYHLLYVRNTKYKFLVKFSFYSTIGMFIYVGNGVLLYITSKLIQLDHQKLF